VAESELYRVEGPIEIASDRLLFWPNNPRLKISDFSEIEFTDEELRESDAQDKIYDLLLSHEHEVGELVQSMSKRGFMREKAPIVMEVPGSNRWLVLEGNRRLTAIRKVLSTAHPALENSVRESLREIPCWVFVHSATDVPLKATISRLIAEQHIKGQKAHTKLQQAHMIYDAYMGFLEEDYGSIGFTLRQDTSERVAAFYDLAVQELGRELAVVQLYKQLMEAGNEVAHSMREKLTWAHKTPGMFARHFGYNGETLELDGPGLERFYDLFVRVGCAIENPKDFSLLKRIMKDGAPSDVEFLRTEPGSLEEIAERVKDQKGDSRFYSELERIENRLHNLKVSDFKETQNEIRMIENISILVERRLAVLAGLDRPGKRGGSSRPLDVTQAMVLSDEFLFDEIDSVLDERRNGTCDLDKIGGHLLQRWEITTRGTPREDFLALVQQVLQRMQAQDRLDVT
jgi:hypothetical protein